MELFTSHKVNLGEGWGGLKDFFTERNVNLFTFCRIHAAAKYSIVPQKNIILNLFRSTEPGLH